MMMMKQCSVITYAILLFFLFSCSSNEVKKEYYSNGKLKTKIVVQKGVRSGEYLEYYSNGTLKVSGTYSDGLKNGVFTFYYEDGSEKEVSTFSRDKPHGTSIIYFPNGAKQYLASFNHGIRTGASYLFHSNGKLAEKKMYRKNDGAITYILKLDELGNELLNFVNPIIELESDTVLLGDQASFNISFGIDLKGEIEVEIGNKDNNVFKADSTISRVNGEFNYTHTTHEIGFDSLYFRISHDDEVDTVSADGVISKKTFFVRDTM